MPVYHLKSSCQAEMVDQNKWPQIGLVGTNQNKIFSRSVDGTIGESGMSTILLDIGTNLGDELQGLLSLIVFDSQTQQHYWFQSNVNSSITSNQWEFHIVY
jgi:hypothetical protein